MSGNKICVILARSGSKRIPKKNLKKFLGQPIISYPITKCIESKLFDRVIVSTDSNEIKIVSEKYGAEVPFLRSKLNSSDNATTMDALREVCSKLNVNNDDLVLCAYATSVFIDSNDLLKGYEILIKQESNTNVFPVLEYSYPIWRSGKIIDGKFKMLFPENVNMRSQDLESVFHDSGQWYWWKASKINLNIINNNTKVIVLENNKIQDIDNESDWKIAEIKYKNG